MNKCQQCGIKFTPNYKHPSQKYCSRKCRSKHYYKASLSQYYQKQNNFGRKLIQELKINGCAICGYNECTEICEFHHVGKKKFKINYGTLGRKDFFKELNKCVLLCPTCHAIIHLKEVENE